MDVMKPEQRHKAMASNRGRTGPERALATALWRRGFRYLTSEGYRKRYGHKLVGQPDLIFPRKKVLIFVDGCFWHGCPECGRVPQDMSADWLGKIAGNRERDRRVTATHEQSGWKVIRLPEHAVRTKKALEETAGELSNVLARIIGEVDLYQG
jgi:DNA mismatch endonuclease, patch repair protein